LNSKQAVEAIRKEIPGIAEVEELCVFVETSQRGIIR
jgi:hypothetical protein